MRFKDRRSYLSLPSKPELPISEAKRSSTGGFPQSRHVTKKRVLAVALSLLSISLLFRPVADNYHAVVPTKHRPSLSSDSIDERVQSILSHTPLIDGHNDMAILIRAVYNNHIYQDNFTTPFEKGGFYGHVDLPRLREGLNGGFFWSVFVPCPADGADFSDENYAESVQFTLQQIDLASRLRAAYPDKFSGNVNSGDALDVFKRGQLISPLGIEGLHQIGNSVANLRRFYDMGVRYSTLTHNCHNKYADAALVEHPIRTAEPKWHGVSAEGKKLVAEMNRIGMIVDLAHTSEETMLHVLGGKDDWEGSQAPIIFSHSSAYSVCPHPRNVKDNVLRLVKERNSLVMINFNPPFIACKESDNDNGLPDDVPEDSNIHQVVKHIMHIGNLIGYDHVGLGSDFDGIERAPDGLEDVSKFPDLIAELLRQGVSDENAAKVAGGNLLRVWRDVDKVAARLQASFAPILEDDLPSLWG
ncbi:hypothetical protein jhhlp_002516 [Lomentospora prolificans]|uniref:Dipeptidase n=1 Tax=Lomentospora prolificans TaxID=41688 RepID=A0A2N3NE99_9PEZI|nr:hypothetical protein jhhlp_002516 [Lomentospora prolificans]